MKKNNYNLSVEYLFGLVKLLLSILILLMGAGIFQFSLKYFDTDFVNGYMEGRNPNTLLFFRLTIVIHLLSSSIVLLLSTPLIFFRIEKKRPSLHRFMGKTVTYISIFFLVPTGFILCKDALGGGFGKIIFFLLTLLTLISILAGFKAIVNRNIDVHKRWMIRFYLLITSALWLRINLFVLFILVGERAQNYYVLAAVLSWIPQLCIAEIYFFIQKRRNLAIN